VNNQLRQLRYFVALAEELHFSRAAERLFVSQQVLSRGIARLERETGARLFDRTTRRVEVTPAGAAMLRPARQALAAADRALDAARAAASVDEPLALRVDISSSGLETGALIIRRLLDEAPELTIAQVEEGVPRGLRALRQGELDVLLGDATAAPADVRSELLRLDTVWIAMPDTHPLSESDVVPVRALAGQPLLLPSDRAAPEWNAFVADLCRRAGFAPRRLPHATHGSQAATDLIRSGACLVPTTTWTETPRGVAFRRLVQPEVRFPWSMMWADEDSPAVQAFLGAARREAARRGWAP
jgi:DNA-binding transcriptional LysR family regulator